MADLSKKEWEHYERPEQSHVFKQIATVMRKGISPEEVAEFYSKWAGDLEYEKELPADVYNAPIVTAEAAADGLTEVQRAEARVLDVAAGTGMSGDRLRAHGFRHVDALDPSEGMLAKARERELYDKYICAFITDQPLDIPENTYDVLTVSAGLGEGHIKCCALTEMIRLVKPGGVIVIVTRFQHLESVEEYRGRLEPLMDQFEKEGRWRRMERRVFPGFFLDKEGILWKYQVC
ncbi:methyltransferase-like protein 27 [Mya arenaria]|uniref:methyltransferase-like protein 27 n=1 Tax=Mya arenaria TaxID=6604 RepID=UPI0022E2864E|nr:methyltransferase-like protein 27 [Mya arenaria]XP_052814516.1 methyltransferase-like protein 27 [Mya arenaria]XP_052814517.1 methyltransferase-like protein 27 [Mya arenaria]XP_052814518.1 methyltransferase-like protein 27 [Mya arenaria]